MMITRKSAAAYMDVECLKNYLGLSDYLADKHAIELASVLERATVSVENTHDCALRDMSIALTLHHAEGRCPLYFHPVAEVAEVTSAGAAISYSYDGWAVDLPSYYPTVVIEYTTNAIDHADMYRSAVLTLAAKLYNDGEE